MAPVHRLSRQERVLSEVRTQTAQELEAGRLTGVDAAGVAAALELDRANVSKELNLLYRSGQLIKLQGKPTRFLHRVLLSQIYPGVFLPTTVPRGEELSSFLSRAPSGVSSTPSSGASELETAIGAEGSLRHAVALAKAAVSYPPQGLHTLIIGSVGVGKIHFAHMMYDYARHYGKLPAEAPFLVFNCQDYAGSPQLLLSQLFGRGKGTVPGSEKGRRGLIEQAAGGILYLDNVQRLPYKVQDLLVTLLEKNTFNRVGEAAVTRYSEVMIIAASSDPPEADSLGHMIRSIPVLITLPDLDERGVKELLEHLVLFFSREASAIGIPFRIHKDVLACLVEAPYPGQIGEMKSRVKIICSSAYLEYSSSPSSGVMEIGYRHLPDAVTAHLPGRQRHSAQVRRLFSRFTQDSILFTPGFSPSLPLAPEDSFPSAQDDPGSLSSTWESDEIRRYMDRCANLPCAQDDLLAGSLPGTISPALYESVQRVLLSREEYRTVAQNSGLLYGFLLHLNGAISRQLQGLPPALGGGNAKHTNPDEYALAQELQEVLEETIHVAIPECELDFIAIYLYLAVRWNGAGQVGLLAVFHGEGVAQGLAAYINSAYSADLVRGICYDSRGSLDSLLAQVVQAAKEADRGSGVLIFSDMEPLTQLHRHITASTNIQAETISGASLPLMLELTGRAARGGCSLQSLAESGRNSCLPLSEEKGYETGSAFLSRIINEILASSLTFLNPRKGAETLLSALDGILHDLGLPYSDEVAVKFIFHSAHMLERVIRGDSLKYAGLKGFVNQNGELILLLEQHFNYVGEIFGIPIPVCELAYVAEIFLPLIKGDKPSKEDPLRQKRSQ